MSIVALAAKLQQTSYARFPPPPLWPRPIKDQIVEPAPVVGVWIWKNGTLPQVNTEDNFCD